MSKRLIILFFLVGMFCGGVFDYIFFSYQKDKMIPANSTSLSNLKITGVLKAINGVDVTTESAGIVQKIHFTSGKNIKAGEPIIELNYDEEKAKLNSLKAVAELAKDTYKRDKEQLAVEGISQATLAEDLSDLKSKLADVAEQEAVMAKKIILAPFEGRLGISAVSLGQYVDAGDKIVPLQSLDPIYIDFSLPQRMLPHIVAGQPIYFTTDAYPDLKLQGKITCIGVKVDPTTQKVPVEAIVSNSDYKLLPGMSGVVQLSKNQEPEVKNQEVNDQNNLEKE